MNTPIQSAGPLPTHRHHHTHLPTHPSSPARWTRCSPGTRARPCGTVCICMDTRIKCGCGDETTVDGHTTSQVHPSTDRSINRSAPRTVCFGSTGRWAWRPHTILHTTTPPFPMPISCLETHLACAIQGEAALLGRLDRHRRPAEGVHCLLRSLRSMMMVVREGWRVSVCERRRVRAYRSRCAVWMCACRLLSNDKTTALHPAANSLTAAV